jgi:hypothetical protein
MLMSSGQPQPWVKTMTSIENLIRPLLSLVYGGAAAFMTPYSLTTVLLQECDVGRAAKLQFAQASELYLVQGTVMGLLAPLVTPFHPLAGTALVAGSALAFVMSNATDNLSQGKPPSVESLLSLAGPVSGIASAAGVISPSAATAIRNVAGSKQAKDAAKGIDAATGAQSMATFDPVDLASLTASQAALTQAGQAAVSQKVDAWPALIQRSQELQQLRSVKDSAGQVLDSISNLLRKPGGKFALYMAVLAKNARKATDNPALRIPVLTNSDVTRWVESRGSAFLRATPSTSSTGGGKSGNGLLIAAGVVGGGLLLLASSRKKKSDNK